MDFRGASAEHVAELTQRFDELAGSEGSTATLADELFTVSRLLRSEPGLRRFATDVSLAPEARQGMVTTVFGKRLSAPTLDLLTDAVGRRWTLGRDLPHAVERLSEIAVVKSAGTHGDRLTDELFSLGRIIDDNPDLRSALSDPARSVEDKAALLDRLLDKTALPATVTLAKQALAGSYHTVTLALATYREVSAEAQGETVATVRVARPLAAADQKRLRDLLSSQYGTTVHLNVVVDPDVLGGIRVEIGDEIIDGTIASRLDEARRVLAG
jgi:F-type H+-transporting ATPase subunit delta